MQRTGLIAIGTAIAIFSLSAPSRAQDWSTVKGQIIFAGAPMPKQAPIPAAAASPDKGICLKDKNLATEEWVIDPKTKGIRDVLIWLAPDKKSRTEAFDPKKIHPKLVDLKVKNVTIEQPCCRFIPHALVAREGQTLTINGSPAIAHNAKWDSSENSAGNPIIPAGGSYTLPKPLKAEPGIIVFNCSIHPWMKSVVKVVDHPYHAVTNEKGEFTIPLAPVGKYRLFIQHPDNGYLGGRDGAFGQTITIKPGATDLGAIKWK